MCNINITILIQSINTKMIDMLGKLPTMEQYLWLSHFFFFKFQDKVSLNSPRWPSTHSVAQTDLELQPVLPQSSQ